MSERWRANYVEVSLSNLEFNFKSLKACVPEAEMICPMVKADGYGHGDTEVACHLEKQEPDYFGVALVEEGAKLRAAGVHSPVLVFGTFDSFSAEATANFNLTPVLSSWDHIKSFERVLEEQADFQVHVKFNTGMARLGFETSEARSLSEYFQKQKRLKLRGVCTHLLNGEDAPDPQGISKEQIRLFDEATEIFKREDPAILSHYQNSSAILQGFSKTAGARPGIALYGIRPPTLKPNSVPLRPVMQWKAALSLVRKVPAGKTVSYGGTWRAPKDSVIGLVPVGYADGYSRAFSNKGEMLIRGKRVPVRGIVCMDYTMIDLTELARTATPQVGEEVLLFGRQGVSSLDVEELAQKIQTIPYEIVTRIGPRVPRSYIH